MAAPAPKPASLPPLVIRRDGVRLLVDVAIVDRRGRVDREQYVITAKRVVDAIDMQARLERWARLGPPWAPGRDWPSFQALHEHADAELDALREYQRRHRSGRFYRIGRAA